MFCNQCEQARDGVGCEVTGVCGKSGEVGVLHDELFLAARRLSVLLLQRPAAERAAAHVYLEEALVATMSNMNFDPQRVGALLQEGATRLSALRRPSAAGGTAQVLAFSRRPTPTLTSLRDLLGHGVKGLAAIAHQARALGPVPDSCGDFIISALAALEQGRDDEEALLELCMRCGAVALTAMGVLDAANSGRFGHPEPALVHLGHRCGHAILVSGHELDDLERILLATEGRGINVYTHGEMMAAHGYPGLRRFAHLAGHIGGAWHDQHKVFRDFPGAIVVTGGCLAPPRASYRDRLFTLGAAAHPKLRVLARDDLEPLLQGALQMPGYAGEQLSGMHRVGFGQRSTSAVSARLCAAMQQGEIERFVLIGGCDGPTRGRDYYSQLAGSLPDNWAVLTLGCGKFRVIGRTGCTIGDLPRLMDVGQCSDSFTAVKLCQSLADGLGVPLAELPLSLVLSWHEQKAVTIILALLQMGLRNIRLGPRLPAFVTPELVDILAVRFGLRLIGDVAEDIRAMARSA